MTEREFHIKPKHLVDGRGLVAQHVVEGKVVEGRAIYKILGRRSIEGQVVSLLLHAQGGQILEVPLPAVLNGGTAAIQFTGVLPREEVEQIYFAPVGGNLNGKRQ